MKLEDKWLDEFRHRMEDYSESLPEGLWEDIEKDLKVPHKVVPIWMQWHWVAAVALLLLVSSLTVWLWNMPMAPNMEESFTQIESIVPQSVVEKMDDSFSDDNFTRENEPSLLVETKKRNGDSFALLMDHENDEDTNDEDIIEKEDLKKVVEEKEEAVELDNNKVMQLSAGHSSVTYRSLIGGKKKSSTWSLGLLAASSQVHANGMRYELYDLAFPNENEIHVPGIDVPSNDSVPQGSQGSHSLMSRTMTRETDSKYNHQAPLTFGMSVRCNMNETWSLESGLMYTLLSSDILAAYTIKQKLHYVGIPLKISRKIWDNPRWSIYAGAGGAVEKCVSAHRTSIYSVKGEIEKKREKLDVNEWQWSLSASLGAQFNLTDRMGIYAEPGIAYYFDDGSSIQTIRKEKPFIFNIQIGLRFTLIK